MLLELHVYGPAFGLPSIDARCLAAIVLLRTCLGDDGWVLISSDNPAANPYNQLPALRYQDLWIAGWSNIVSYLSETYIDVDRDLDAKQLARRDAYTSMIESRGLPLLDLSLYVSSDNYTSCTRSALAEVLSWPRSWTLPSRLRDQARRRSQHLGLGSLDVDAVREKELKREDQGLSAQIPKSLRRPAPSVASLLGSTAQQTRFRLEAVTADFMEPLQYYIQTYATESRTSLDCLAIGVTAQMLICDLPQPWLADLMKDKYSALHDWAQKQASLVFGAHPSAEAKAVQSTTLPWQSVPPSSWLDTASSAFDTVLASLPLVGETDVTVQSSDRSAGTMLRLRSKQGNLQKQKDRQRALQLVVAGCISCAGLCGLLVYNGLLQLPRPRPKPSRRSFGQAGALLGLR